jgi:hypothetical protein
MTSLTPPAGKMTTHQAIRVLESAAKAAYRLSPNKSSLVDRGVLMPEEIQFRELESLFELARGPAIPPRPAERAPTLSDISTSSHSPPIRQLACWKSAAPSRSIGG